MHLCLQEEGEGVKSSKILETILEELNRQVNFPPSPIYLLKIKNKKLNLNLAWSSSFEFGYKSKLSLIM
jgi:hypothetical protein